MSLRSVDSPGEIKPKSKFYFVIRIAILCLLGLCIVAGIMIKNIIFPPYKKVLDDLCIAIQRTDGKYMQEHIPGIQNDDTENTKDTEEGEGMKQSQWSDEQKEEYQKELNNYVLQIVSQISEGGEEEEEEQEEDIDDVFFANNFLARQDDSEENNIQNVSYKILEKHKLKSWDVTQDEEEESSESANRLRDYIESGYLEEEEIKIGFSDYAYQYGSTYWWGRQKQYKNFDKENVYMLMVEFSFTKEESEKTYQTIVYVAKAEKRWVLLYVENIDNYENLIFGKDEL